MTVTLTREEAQQVLDAILIDIPLLPCDREVKEHAIETLRARLAEKEQEPVAWMYQDDYEQMQTSETYCTVFSVPVGHPTQGKSTVALYTAPPQREWVGLTDEEAYKLMDQCDSDIELLNAAEAKLKEKNE